MWLALVHKTKLSPNIVTISESSRHLTTLKTLRWPTHAFAYAILNVCLAEWQKVP